MRRPTTAVSLCASLAAVVFAAATAAPAPGEELDVFFGNLHSHTSYSDGSGTPTQAYTHARDVAGLDFLAVTEHNHKAAESGDPNLADGLLIGKDHSLYKGPQAAALIPAAKAFTEDGRFVALYGQEFSSISKGNHVNVFDVPEVIDETVVKNGAYDSLLAWMEDADHHDTTGAVAVMQLNHPGLNERDFNRDLEYGRDDFGSDAEWVKRMGKHARLIEVLNGPAKVRDGGHRPAEVKEADYHLYLRWGFHVAPTADQDNHYLTWGTATDARTGVVADGLTKAKLLAALRARHVYATEDRNLKLIFKVNGALCGDVLPPPQANSPLTIEYRISDADEPDADYRIDVFSGTVGGAEVAVVNSETAEGDTPADQPGTIEDVRYTGGRQFFFFRVTQAGEHERDRSWTAPVWFEAAGDEVDDGDLPPPDDDADVANFVASKRSNVYHVSAECKDAKAIKPANVLRGEAARRGRNKHQGCPRR